MRLVGSVGVLAALVALAGCGGSGLNEVSGVVTFKGKPLESGTIRFEPTGPGGAAAGGTTIANGKYTIPRSQGLPAGTYKVSISSLGGNARAKDIVPGSEPVKVEREAIPTKYNAQSTLTCTVEAGSNTKDFALD